MIGWRANLRHLETWSSYVLTKVDDGGEDQRSGNSHTMRNQSLQNAVYRLGNFVWHEAAGGPDDKLVDFFDRAEYVDRPTMIMDSLAAEIILLGFRFAILAALCFVGIRLGQRGDALSIATAFSLACVAMLIVSPVARAHYFMLLVPAILYLPLWLDREDRVLAAKIMAIVPMVLVDLHYVFLPLAGRVGLLGLGTTAWLLTAFAYISRSSVKKAVSVQSEDIVISTCPPVLKRAA